MFKIIALVVVVLLAALLIYAATKPDTFRVQRSASINAPPEKIFSHINDFHSWGPWSPYEKKDPAMRRTYSGSANGRGAVYEWDGDKTVGKGRIEITESSLPTKVTMALDMLTPFEAHNIVVFTLDPKGDSTNVTWAMNGHTPYIAKVVHVFFDMDSMVGKDFETGLANLKTIVEK
jgi:Polyketide cyclase / dehydrase and lipid transport